MIMAELLSPLGLAIWKPKRSRSGQSPTLPERMSFESLQYLARSGVPWRDLGALDAVFDRFHLWLASSKESSLAISRAWAGPFVSPASS